MKIQHVIFGGVLSLLFLNSLFAMDEEIKIAKVDEYDDIRSNYTDPLISAFDGIEEFALIPTIKLAPEAHPSVGDFLDKNRHFLRGYQSEKIPVIWVYANDKIYKIAVLENIVVFGYYENTDQQDTFTEFDRANSTSANIRSWIALKKLINVAKSEESGFCCTC